MRYSLLSLFALAAVACCPQGEVNQAADQWTDAEIEAKINEILPQLTLEEKVALCHAQSKFSTPGVPRLGIPELWYSDGPHGVRAEINWDDWGYAGWTNDSCTAFPALTALAASFNLDLSADYGKAVAEEALYRKKDVMLGPGVEMYRTPLCGRNFEYMGEDPFLASKMCVPYIKAMQEQNVAVCVKHFALNNQEQWRTLVDVHVSDRALRELYLAPYEAAVKEGGAWSIMGSYNLYDGQHCCHNKKLNDILRGEWGFDGCVVTDWGGATNTIEAANNGLDIEMGTYTNGFTESAKFAYDDYYLAKPYIKALKEGTVKMETLDQKARNILRLMFRTNMAKNRKRGCMGTKEHFQTALNVAREGITLLKNDGAILPLDPNTTKTIAVIGENATRSTLGGGSSELKGLHEISPLDGIRAAFPKANVIWSMGYGSGPECYGRVAPSPYNADSLFTEAVKAAKQADIVLFFGGLVKAYQQDMEGGDRIQYGLPFGQDELINAILDVNKNVVAVMISGNAVAMPWIDRLPALIQGWYLGSEAGNALADVISGKVNPSGKLPFSFPVRLEDNAVHSFGEEVVYPGVEKDSYREEYKEGIFIGYRWHEAKGIKPLFPFGFGLSYTQFEIADAQLSQDNLSEGDVLAVTATVKNVGSREGKEVVQVYVGKKDSRVERAPKELKGFAKVSVPAGSQQQVKINIPIKSLAFFNEDANAWEVEKGEYTVFVGNASDNITAQLPLNVKD
ncbi:MAG: glycoside hydrolase family 3 C-terminal domain-containing protein [Bacteroidales bacterium]|nr:glycoside hydrolase family 3 C-terminal domain-containing protein [Bacteroidales bacterium]MDY4175376.1 glycoside hydrolase family 3 C-terminal domain-containing protein [Bacteroidales bacterium]